MTEKDIYTNKIICGDSIKILKDFNTNSIDLVLTSPPYFNAQHKYQRGKGFHYSIDYGEILYTIEDVSKELLRIVKFDGAYALNLGFSYGETGVLRPFRIIERLINQGWFAIDVIIWHKNNPVPLKQRFTNAFEYIFILSKNALWSYKTEIKYEHNVWKFPITQGSSNLPAIFPEELAIRCIKVMSKENDVVLDPFVGSGTTCVAAQKLNRRWIGIDINSQYCEYARKRMGTKAGCNYHAS